MAFGQDSSVTAGIFLFTRFPQPGETKTRLIPALGPEGAAQVQRQMTEYVLQRLQGVSTLHEFSLQVHFTGATQDRFTGWLGSEVLLIPQCEGCLGTRLLSALQRGFADGLQRIVVLGSDCPEIDESLVARSLSLLDSHDVVLGPAVDGGYYLIALKQPHPFLFESIPWGSEAVLEKTRSQASRHGLTVALLKVLADVDRPEDLPVWYARRGGEMGSREMGSGE